MESRSTHGLRLDQLADLLLVAAIETDSTAAETSAERPREAPSRRLPDNAQRAAAQGMEPPHDSAA
jgi:hypothetical protein